MQDTTDRTHNHMENEGSDGPPGSFANPIHVRTGRLPIAFGPKVPSNEAAANVWDSIRLHTDLISFPYFSDFVKRAFSVDDNWHFGADLKLGEKLGSGARLTDRLKELERFKRERCAPNDAPIGTFGFIPGTDLYSVLKLTAEVFLLTRCGVCRPEDVQTAGEEEGATDSDFDPAPEESQESEPVDLSQKLTQFLGQDRNSYIQRIIYNVFGRDGLTVQPMSPVSIGFGPCLIELIWSYWHEQGMQVQTANAIALRFQNVVVGDGRDPLAELEIDPLRPLSGVLWGYIQDEPFRLSVMRRAYEYQHHYGLSLHGKAVRKLRAADVRSKFLRAFHDLLRLADQYFRESADNTVTPDAFPLLIALRDLHMILAEGAHNQFRDLPWTARVEMLVQQWMLARQEIRDFLRGRLMVPYAEGWMGAVDAMKRLQGWSDTNITHFHDLGVFGERLLLSVRHVAWDAITLPTAAEDWALFWRPEIQGYIHAYRAATGVSLNDDVVEVSTGNELRYVQPSQHLRRQLEQQRNQALPQGESRARFQLGALSRPATPER